MSKQRVLCWSKQLFLITLSSLYPLVSYSASAGKIEFATGSVTAVNANGAQRTLAKGAEFETGDTLITGSTGRAQVRFTDGAAVSLQPQTEFRIDEYHYNTSTAGEEKGFFSLLKGGMRTITGLIGRKARSDYQVRVPFATIGIRGTEYTAGLNATNDELLVNTGEGLVEVCAAGSCLVLAGGESAQVRPGNMPHRSDARPHLSPAQRSGDNHDVRDDDKYSSSEERESSGEATAIRPRMADGNGFAVRYASGASSALVSNATTDFNKSGMALKAFTSAGTGTSDAVEFGNDGTIGWGRWTNGTATVEENSQTFSANQGLHYVVGLPTAAMPSSGSFSYSLLGATSPTVVSGSYAPGTLNSASLSANFSTLSLLANLSVKIAGSTFNFTNNLGSISGNSFSAPLISSGGICATGCTGTLTGNFFGTSGERAGLNYSFNGGTFISETIIGAIALKRP